MIEDLASKFDSLATENREFWLSMAVARDLNGHHIGVALHTFATECGMTEPRAFLEAWTWVALARQCAGMEAYGCA
jgi:hypothetical protein